MKKSGKPDGNHPTINPKKGGKSTGSRKGGDTHIPTDVSGKSIPGKGKWECDNTAKWKGLPGAGNKDLDISTDVG